MSDLQLSVTAKEQECLVNLLETSLKDSRVEEHRTRAPSYREHIVRQEEVIAGLLKKLGFPAR